MDKVEIQRVLDRLNSSDPDFDDCANAAALILRMAAEMEGPEGYATWNEAAVAERARCKALESENAALRAELDASNEVIRNMLAARGPVLSEDELDAIDEGFDAIALPRQAIEAAIPLLIAHGTKMLADKYGHSPDTNGRRHAEQLIEQNRKHIEQLQALLS